MDLPLILMGSGAIIVLISLFSGNSTKRLEKELEELTLSFYNENNQLKRRIKVIEEELLLSTKPASVKPLQKQPQKKATTTPVSSINKILVSQVLVLHEQGYSMSDISQRSSLSYDQIATILKTEVKS